MKNTNNLPRVSRLAFSQTLLFFQFISISYEASLTQTYPFSFSIPFFFSGLRFFYSYFEACVFSIFLTLRYQKIFCFFCFFFKKFITIRILLLLLLFYSLFLYSYFFLGFLTMIRSLSLSQIFQTSLSWELYG